MRRFERLTAIAAALPLANVDTDKILAGRFLKTTSREGLGGALFSAMRYQSDGSERADFVLNRPPWRDAGILVSGANFGCGSSREHAPWALVDFGIRCVIAPSFADIFFANCCKNGILPVALAGAQVDVLLADAGDPARALMSVDLENMTIRRCCGELMTFVIDPRQRRALLLGLDEIQGTLEYLSVIESWEASRRSSYKEIPCVPV